MRLERWILVAAATLTAAPAAMAQATQPVLPDAAHSQITLIAITAILLALIFGFIWLASRFDAPAAAVKAPAPRDAAMAGSGAQAAAAFAAFEKAKLVGKKAQQARSAHAHGEARPMSDEHPS
jgi:hypothetical protein